MRILITWESKRDGTGKASAGCYPAARHVLRERASDRRHASCRS